MFGQIFPKFLVTKHDLRFNQSFWIPCIQFQPIGFRNGLFTKHLDRVTFSLTKHLHPKLYTTFFHWSLSCFFFSFIFFLNFSRCNGWFGVFLGYLSPPFASYLYNLLKSFKYPPSPLKKNLSMIEHSHEEIKSSLWNLYSDLYGKKWVYFLLLKLVGIMFLGYILSFHDMGRFSYMWWLRLYGA